METLFPRCWPFMRGIHRSPVDSTRKDQGRGGLMFSLICVWTNGWANIRDAGDLRRHRAHYDSDKWLWSDISWDVLTYSQKASFGIFFVLAPISRWTNTWVIWGIISPMYCVKLWHAWVALVASKPSSICPGSVRSRSPPFMDLQHTVICHPVHCP